MTTVCSNTDKFRLKTGPGSGAGEIVANNNSNVDICTATKILERLHKEFTEQYVTTAATGKTLITNNDVLATPTFYLRKQPTRAGFISKRDATDTKSPIQETTGGTVNRFYDIFTTMDESHEEYRKAVSVILKGDATTEITLSNYRNNPDSIRGAIDFSNPSVFKGLYGLARVNELLEGKIAKTVNELKGQVSSNVLDDALHYEKRKNIKTTLEEIAYRENEIYREKFLNIVLVIVGIFIVSSQIMKDYSSFSGGGGGIGSSGSGFGGVGGWLSTRFGSGSGGIFSRFGGLGLGSSGRSRIGNLFTSSPYSTSQRE